MKKFSLLSVVFLFFLAGAAAAAPPTLEDCWGGEGTTMYYENLTPDSREETHVVEGSVEIRFFQREKGLVRGEIILTENEPGNEITLSFTGFMNKLRALKGTSWTDPAGPTLQDWDLLVMDASLKGKIMEGVLSNVLRGATTHFTVWPVDCP